MTIVPASMVAGVGTSQSLGSKLLQLVSAADYGASVSATLAANTAAINSAIAVCTGGFVLVPPGISYTEASLVMQDYVTVLSFTTNGVVTFLSKNQGQTPIAKAGIAVKAQGHTGVLLRAVDQDVSTEPLLQLVDLTTGDIAALHSKFIELDEASGIALPAANKVRIICKDNGSGKTQLAVQFPTGAVQVIATEP